MSFLKLGALLALAVCNLSVCTGQMGMPGMGGGKKEKSPVVKGDIKYIKCQVCEELTKNLHRDVKKMRDDLPAKKQLAELDVIEKVEKACDPDSTAGEWITTLDLVEEGDKLKVEVQETRGKCKSECRTIAKACEEIVDDYDTDIAEVLWKGDIKRAKLNELVCRDLSGACNKKTPKVKKGRKPIEEFTPMTDQEIEMDKLMKSMQDIPGMPGMSMHSREDMMAQMANGDYGGYGGGYGDDYGGDYGDMGDMGGTGGDYGDYGEAGDEGEYGKKEEASSGQEGGVEKIITEGMSVVKDAVSSSLGSIKDMASNAFSGMFQKKDDSKTKIVEL